MDQSQEHTSAVYEAVRVPAMEARLQMLMQGSHEIPSSIEIYGCTRPVPGEAPEEPPIVSIDLREEAGAVEDEIENSVRKVRLRITTPIEKRVQDIGDPEGAEPSWARIKTPTGDWWADISVSVEGEGGELQLEQTGTENGQPIAKLFDNSFARISNFVIEG